jgi:hypothetical protein
MKLLTHILCRCEALASISHALLDSFFLVPEDIKRTTLGAIWRFSKAAGLPWENDLGTKGRTMKGLSVSEPKGPEPFIYLSINQSRVEQEGYI